MLVLAVLLAIAGFIVHGRTHGATTAPTPLVSACPPSLVPGGHDYHGLSLTLCNFSRQDLTKADFRNAVLTAVSFLRADLTGADFSGAVMHDSGNAVQPVDFSFSNLNGTRFVGTRFLGPTYFTYARLTCADFSQTDLEHGQAIFGDEALTIVATPVCRTMFHGTTMNCEFIAQWGQLDLGGANVGACASQLQTAAGASSGHDFSGGIYTGVVFDKLDLSRSRWSGAALEGASFNGATLDGATGLDAASGKPARLSAASFVQASVQHVDLGAAQLYGADFTQANLSESRLSGAYLEADGHAVPKIPAARFDGARLKNVDLSGAKLGGVSFRNASFYGSFAGAAPSFPCQVTAGARNRVGTFTNGCATASGADLSDTDFTGAYLYGVDFSGSGTTAYGTHFKAAILVGASFEGTSFASNGAVAPDFSGALLQGTTFSANARLLRATLTNAFLDFGAATNSFAFNVVNLLLGPEYTRFRGGSGKASTCVQALYGAFSVVPSNVSMTCPNGASAVCGAGRPAPNPNPAWAAAAKLSSNAPVPGWYGMDSTYEPANPAGESCGNGTPPDPGW